MFSCVFRTAADLTNKVVRYIAFITKLYTGKLKLTENPIKSCLVHLHLRLNLAIGIQVSSSIAACFSPVPESVEGADDVAVAVCNYIFRNRSSLIFSYPVHKT